jgi:hypothetical protein
MIEHCTRSSTKGKWLWSMARTLRVDRHTTPFLGATSRIAGRAARAARWALGYWSAARTGLSGPAPGNTAHDRQGAAVLARLSGPAVPNERWRTFSQGIAMV